MNRIYNTIWNEARGTYVVAHEKSKSKGKPSSTRKGVVSAVAAALLAMAAAPAMAATNCSVAGSITIDGAATSTCNLHDGDTLNVTGSIQVAPGGSSSGPAIAVLVSQYITPVSIVNSGTIKANASNGNAFGIKLTLSAISAGITNSGLISSIGTGSGVGGRGISSASSTISGGITNSGTISANGHGIELYNNSVLNAPPFGVNAIYNTGLIQAYSAGWGDESAIVINGTQVNGDIFNDGGTMSGAAYGINIVGSTITGSSGIIIVGSTITGSIRSSGLISGGVNGIRVDSISTISGATGILIGSGGSVSGGINNSGAILGTNYGVALNGDIDHLTNSGTISGGIDGVAVRFGSIGSLTNSGNISGTSDGVLVSSGSIDSLTNSGNISGSSGVSITSHSILGSLTNSGTISGSAGEGIAIVSSTITGGIANNAGGTISGSAYGIGLFSGSTIAGGITSSGLISGGTNGIYVDSTSTISGTTAISIDTGGTVSGGINNNGNISGSRDGILINHGTITGGLTNSGTISGVTAIFIDAGGSVSGGINNDGNISGSHDGIVINGGTITGGLTNNGTISGDANVGIYLESGRLDSLTNSNTISGQWAIWLRALGSISGDITNNVSGKILGLSTGIGINGTVTGSIINSGVISASVNAIAITQNARVGGITNSGTIGSGAHGILLSNSSVDSINNNGGTISAGTAIAMLSNSIITGGITNSGTLNGVCTGIWVAGSQVAGGITNNGLINGTHCFGISVLGYQAQGSNNSIGSNVDSIINNADGIISGSTGIKVGTGSSITGGITNSGLIVGSTNSIYVDNSSTIVGGVQNQLGGKLVGGLDLRNGTSLVNNGTIVLESGVSLANANAAAVQQSTVSGTTTNSTISGNFTQGSAGVLRIGVASQADYSKLSVGSANLGGTLDVDVKTTTLSGSLLNVITASGSITGTFASVTDNSDLFNFSAIYRGTQAVDLGISAASTTGVYDDVVAENNMPATGAARTLDTIISADPTGPIALLFQPLGSQREVSNAASQTLPLLTGGMAQAMSNTLHGSNRIIQARQEGQHGRSSGDEFLGDKHAWFKPFGSWANQSDRNGVSGYDANTYGMVFGADAEVSDTNRLGVAFAYAHSNVDSNSSVAHQSAKVNSNQLIAYGSHNISDATDISFQADIGKHDNEGLRNITFAGSTAKSDYTSWSGHVGAGLAHTYALSEKTTLTPSVRADYTRVRDAANTETGAGALNLRVNSNTNEELILGLDGKLAHAFSDKATLTANLGLGYDVINEQASITAAFAGAPTASFVTNGLDSSPWLLRGGLGVVGKATETVEISARYDVEARKDFDNQTASVKVRWAF